MKPLLPVALPLPLLARRHNQPSIGGDDSAGSLDSVDSVDSADSMDSADTASADPVAFDAIRKAVKKDLRDAVATGASVAVRRVRLPTGAEPHAPPTDVAPERTLRLHAVGGRAMRRLMGD